MLEDTNVNLIVYSSSVLFNLLLIVITFKIAANKFWCFKKSNSLCNDFYLSRSVYKHVSLSYILAEKKINKMFPQYLESFLAIVVFS